jgi:hypothetical protein
LFELLAGRRPFLADSREGYMGAHLSQPVPSLAQVRPGLARASLFQAVVARAMAKKPSDRFKDADAMLAALEDVVARLPPGALNGASAEARRKSAPHPTTASPSGSLFWRGALSVFLVAAGIAAAKAYLRREGPKPVKTTALPAQPLPKPALPPPKPALPPPAPVAKTEPPLPPPAEVQAPVENLAPPEQPKQPEQTQHQVAPVNAAKAAQGARDPWQEPVPRPLKSIRDRVNRGVHMNQRALTPVYEFAHQNPGDPRPWLLLGRAYAQLDWLSDAVERYVRAYHVDSTSRGDPQMLADLVKAAAHPVAGRNAARAVRDIYGAEAIPAVDQALDRRASDREATARLARLRESLSP